MKLKHFFIIFILILFVAVFQLLAGDKNKAEKHPEVDYSISCQECHSELTPEIFQEWQDSKHGVMNYGCYMCHGDGVEEFAAKPGSERCTACHSPQTVDFSQLPV
ncbi:MAG: hypothetical protein JXL67_09330, partial [Calditrichaeota bacterium]|nr:hypothetical protein [Calditrichota bacterium]